MAYFGADGEIRPPRFHARRHAPGTETVHRTVSMLRIALFESLYIKKRTSTKVLVLFLAQMERFELSRRLPTLRP